MSRTSKLSAYLILVLFVVGCGGPSKTEVCGDCEKDEMKKCRTSYDVCKLATYCSVKALKNKLCR